MAARFYKRRLLVKDVTRLRPLRLSEKAPIEETEKVEGTEQSLEQS